MWARCFWVPSKSQGGTQKISLTHGWLKMLGYLYYLMTGCIILYFNWWDKVSFWLRNFKRQDTVRAIGNSVYNENPQIVKRAFFISYLNWVVAIILPMAYWNAASQEGYPWDPHIIFAIYCIFVGIFELYVAFTINRERLFSFCDYTCFCGFGWIVRIIFDLLVGVLSRGDVYTDGMFVVIAYLYDLLYFWNKVMIFQQGC